MKIYTTIHSIPISTILHEFVLIVNFEDGLEVEKVMVGNTEVDIACYQQNEAIHELIEKLFLAAGVDYTKEDGAFIING